MTKFKHDSFAKSYLRELLSTIGNAVPNRRIQSEEREADLWFGAMPTSTPGVYEFPKLQRTGLIVVHLLPKTAETLWLRILGRESNQRQAIEEFTEKYSSDELHVTIEELLANYRIQLENLGQTLTEEEKELIMNLSAAYLKKQQEWLEEGEKKGVERNRREIAIAALRQGYSSEAIRQLTQLSLEEIEKLRADFG